MTRRGGAQGVGEPERDNAGLQSEAIESRNPARPDEVVWRGEETLEALQKAMARARAAARPWAQRSAADRMAALERWRAVCAARAEEVAQLITREMGKTLEESRAEAKLLGDKVTISLEEISQSRVREFTVAAAGGRSGECRFQPYGVMAVIGPFNFPAHLPNGHWVPALLQGNTIVFKPSEKTPAVGELLGRMAVEAGLGDGVFQVVQGGPIVARALVTHPDLDGILFTGSWPVGRAILEANLDRPGRMIALEMGGSNPALVFADIALSRGATDAGVSLLEHTVAECVRSAFVTTGQRCTCTRRIIVERPIAERFMEMFIERTKALTIGAGDALPAPFMGPLVSGAAREAALKFVRDRVAHGARVRLEPRIPGSGEAMAPGSQTAGWFMTPGVIEVDRFTRDDDDECFGPVVQIAVAETRDAMIDQANASAFGLAAAVFTADDSVWDECRTRVRVGCINRNCGTAGASGKLPFGGLGRSGNLRPAGAFSADYCSFPQASLIDPSR